ncbi:hypothetical protein PG985_007887 [Apiospora marii]|uniref:FHA domain-containing protein n=1 Tax=Apiospora marii TaxID=335849 RepID=A0ABR1R8Z3_9PEZI
MSHENESDVGSLSDPERLQLLRARWPVFENEPEPAPGYDAFLVVLRHIYSFVPTDVLPQYGEESLQVLQVARKPVLDANAGLVKESKRSSLFELIDEPQSHPDRLRFQSLAQNPNLVARFWSRYYFRLYSPTVLALAPGSQDWVLDEPYEAQKIALESLYRWDGTRPLGESLGALFGVFRHPPTGWRYLRLPGMPTILRVLYNPNGDQLMIGPEFHQIRRFDLAAKDCEPTDGENQSFELKQVKCQYRLVAAVDLTNDTVRLYGIDGAYIRAPPDHGHLVDVRGSIGDIDRPYMLFFARTADDAPPQVPETPEIVLPPFLPEEGGFAPTMEADDPNEGFDDDPNAGFDDDPNAGFDDDAEDDEPRDDGEAQLPKQPEDIPEVEAPTFTMGVFHQSAPALDLEDESLNIALGNLPAPAKSIAANQYGDSDDDESEPEPEPEPEPQPEAQDIEMGNVHPDRRSATARPPSPSHDNRRDDRRPRERSWSPRRPSRRPSPRRRSPSPRRRSPYREGPSPYRRGPSPYRRGPSPTPPPQRADRYRPEPRRPDNTRSRPMYDYRNEYRDDFGPPSGRYPRGESYDDAWDNREPYRDRGPPPEYRDPRRYHTPRSSDNRRRSRSPSRDYNSYY